MFKPQDSRRIEVQLQIFQIDLIDKFAQSRPLALSAGSFEIPTSLAT